VFSCLNVVVVDDAKGWEQALDGQWYGAKEQSSIDAVVVVMAVPRRPKQRKPGRGFLITATFQSIKS